MVRLEGNCSYYYFDHRLSQLRNVDDPQDFIDLTPLENEVMSLALSVVDAPKDEVYESS